MTMRIMTAAPVFLLLLSAASAASNDGLADAILGCAAQPDDQAQLACFRQIAVQLKAGASVTVLTPSTGAEPVAPAQSPAVVSPPPAEAQAAVPAARESNAWYDVGSWFGSRDTSSQPARRVVGTPTDFGQESLPQRADDPVPLDHITTGVTNISFNFFGQFTVTLDNGQIWRQEGGDSTANRFPKGRPFSVTITRGFMGAYNLSIDGRTGSYLVKRIK